MKPDKCVVKAKISRCRRPPQKKETLHEMHLLFFTQGWAQSQQEQSQLLLAKGLPLSILGKQRLLPSSRDTFVAVTDSIPTRSFRC